MDKFRKSNYMLNQRAIVGVAKAMNPVLRESVESVLSNDKLYRTTDSESLRSKDNYKAFDRYKKAKKLLATERAAQIRLK